MREMMQAFRKMPRQLHAESPIGRLRATCVLVPVLTASLLSAPLGAQAPERGAAPHVWLDSAGEPLPFQTHREILEYLRTASAKK